MPPMRKHGGAVGRYATGGRIANLGKYAHGGKVQKKDVGGKVGKAGESDVEVRQRASDDVKDMDSDVNEGVGKSIAGGVMANVLAKRAPLPALAAGAYGAYQGLKAGHKVFQKVDRKKSETGEERKRGGSVKKSKC